MMSASTKSFKVSFTFRKKPHDQPVHFKMDGARFELERTLKFNVQSKYNVEITMNPAMSLSGISIFGANPNLLVKHLDHDSVVYKAEWLTIGIEKCRKSKRQQVPVIIQIKNLEEMRIIWQCKFYSESEGDHTCWGDVCKSIDYECKVEKNSSCVTIIKETFT